MSVHILTSNTEPIWASHNLLHCCDIATILSVTINLAYLFIVSISLPVRVALHKALLLVRRVMNSGVLSRTFLSLKFTSQPTTYNIVENLHTCAVTAPIYQSIINQYLMLQSMLTLESSFQPTQNNRSGCQSIQLVFNMYTNLWEGSRAELQVPHSHKLLSGLTLYLDLTYCIVAADWYNESNPYACLDPSAANTLRNAITYCWGYSIIRE